MLDVTIVAALSLTKNRTGEHDSEVYKIKKGKPWHFGMKAPIGAEVQSDLVHTLVTIPANTRDVTQA